jgi:hypothetical protein
MGSNKDTLARVRRSSDHIADTVHKSLETGCAYPIKEPLTRFHILGRKGGAYDTGAILADGPEVSQVIHETLGLDFRHDPHSTNIFQVSMQWLGGIDRNLTSS